MPGPDPVAGGRRFGQPKCGGPMLLRHTVRLLVVVSLSAVTGQLGRADIRPGAGGGPPTASRLEVSTVLRLSLPSARVLLCHSPGRRWSGPPTVSRRTKPPFSVSRHESRHELSRVALSHHLQLDAGESLCPVRVHSRAGSVPTAGKSGQVVTMAVAVRLP